jgi:multisubunit Na+/H+ antiporter MnhC subunit
MKKWFGGTGGDEDMYNHKVLAIGKKRFYTPLSFMGLIWYLLLLVTYVQGVYINFQQDLLTSVSHFNVLGTSVVAGVILAASFLYTTLPTLKHDKDWNEKWENEPLNPIFLKVALTLCIIAIAPYLLFHVDWMNVLDALATFAGILTITILTTGTILFVLTRKKLWGKVLTPVWWVIKIFFRPIIWLAELVVDSIFSEQSSRAKKVYRSNNEQRKILMEKSFNLETLPAKVNLETAPASLSLVHKFRVGFWSMKAKVCKPYAK